MLGNYFRVLYSKPYQIIYTYVRILYNMNGKRVMLNVCIHLRISRSLRNICWLTSTTHFPEMLLAKRHGFELNR